MREHETQETTRAGPSPAQRLAPFVIAFLAYFLAGKLGQATSNIRSSNLGPVWPAYGIALAMFLTYGARIWPSIAASAYAVAVGGSVSVLAAAGQAAGATLAAWTGMTLLHRIRGFDPSLSRLRDALGLIVFGAFGSSLVSSAIGVSALYLTGIQTYSGLLPGWLIYWLGDSTGVLLITPLVVTLPRLRFGSRERILEFVALVVFLTIVCAMIFGDWPLLNVRLHVLAFTVVPFVMWAAIRFGIAGASLSVFLIATSATVLTAFGSGPFVGNTTFINAVLLDILFAVLALSGLTLAAVIAEREQAEHEREQLIREQTALEARLHLAAIVESSEDAIFSQNLNGVILSWNAAAQRMFGYSAAEAIGQKTTMLIPPELRDVERNTLSRVNAGERVAHETTRLTKSGARLAVSVTLSPLKDAEGKLVGVAKIVRDIDEQRKAREALSTVNRRLIEAQELERSRIARELHDDIAQRLALLAADLEQGAAAPGAESSQLRRAVNEIASDVQALSHNLHSAKLDLLGLAAACARYCEEFSLQHRVKVTFESRDVPARIPPHMSLCLYRILQEALGNAAKHGGAEEIAVQVWRTGTDLNLVVRDAGMGFDVRQSKLAPGIGLVSMHERIKLVAGDLSIESAPQHGTTIRARVPLAETMASA